MKVFVTGGNGFVGSRTVRKLSQAGYDVRCLLRRKSDIRRIEHLPYEAHIGDILDISTLEDGMQGVDAVIHLACISSWSQIREQSHHLMSVVVEGTRNVLEAARNQGVSKILHVSSSAAINASKSPVVFNEESHYSLLGTSLNYSIAKYQAERVVLSYVRNFDMDAVIVNPCEIYGENDEQMITAGNILEILKGPIAVVCSGGSAIAHVDDVSQGIIQALERGKKGERYILGGENLTLAQIARLARTLAGKRRRVVELPNSALRALCKGMERMGVRPPVPVEVLDYAGWYWFVDSSKAQKDLGYSWRSAEQTLEGLVSWLINTSRIH